jgi:hypothetical protein
MYYCVRCAASIETGLTCKQCSEQAAAAGQSRIEVKCCNFCGGSMRGRMGTECDGCEWSRLLRLARTNQLTSKKKSKAPTTGEQQTLWEASQ